MKPQLNGHFAAKHPPGTIVNANVKEALETCFQEGGITCATAHAQAARLNLGAGMVGQAIDLLEARILKCQLGLFGYGPSKKLVTADHTVAPDLQSALEPFVKTHRITCAEAWRIANRLALPRLSLGYACEALGIKITSCQLGAF